MRRLVLISVVGVVVLAAAYTGWWFHAADGLKAGVAAWQVAGRAEGWNVALGRISVQGFPFRLEVIANGFSIGRAALVRWRWSGPRLMASVPLWGGTTLALDAPGVHRLEATLPGRRLALTLDAATAHGTARLDSDGRIARLDVALAGVDGHTGDDGRFHADSIVLALAGPPADAPAPGPGALRAPEAGQLHLSADGIDLRDGRSGALGPRIDHVEADVALDGTLPAAGSPRAALEGWRAAGGTIELRRIKIDWGTFRSEADGTLALDSEMQPIGAFTTRLWRFDQALDALVAAGRIDPRAGAVAKIVLRVMAKPVPAPGMASEVEVPLTLQNRKLYLGPAVLARLPRIVWPGPVGKR